MLCDSEGTPLAVMSMALDLLLDTELSKQQRVLLDDVLIAKEMLCCLSRKTLKQNMMEHDAVWIPSLKPTNLTVLMNQCKRMMQYYGNATHTTEYFVDPELPDEILTDETWLLDRSPPCLPHLNLCVLCSLQRDKLDEQCIQIQ